MTCEGPARRRQLLEWAAILGAAGVLASTSARAQTDAPLVNLRRFPPHTKVGKLLVGVFPEATLNGKPVRFSPGGRIFDQQNVIAIPSTLTAPVIVRYHLDFLGQIDQAWVLTDAELEAARRER